MKNNISLIIVLLISYAVCSCTGNDILEFQTSEISVDGDISDWGEPLRYYDDDLKMMYELCNDGENLYIAFQCIDQQMQMNIIHSGFSVSFDIKSKPKIKARIDFPEMDRRGMPMRREEEINTETPPGFKHDFLKASPPASVEGFQLSDGNIERGIIEKNKISYAINRDENLSLTYEIKIPFAEFFGSTFELAEIQKNKFTMSLEAEAMGIPGRPNPPGGMPGGGGPGGDMSGGRPGGPPDGDRNHPGNMDTLASKTIELTYKFYPGSNN